MVTAAYPLLSGPTKAVGFLDWYILACSLSCVLWGFATPQILAAWQQGGWLRRLRDNGSSRISAVWRFLPRGKQLP
jgi:hypothetical protein